MKREGETCSQEWKGANDDGITEAEVISPKVKDKSLQKALDPEGRPRKHSGHAEEIIRSHPSENASARTARSLTPLRRRSPSPLRRRQTPVLRRWSRTRDEKQAHELPQDEFSYASRRSEDIVVA